MSTDIGCIQFAKCEIQRNGDDSCDNFANGIVFVTGPESYRGGGCYSALGLAPHFGSPETFDAPETFQIVVLSDNCQGTRK